MFRSVLVYSGLFVASFNVVLAPTNVAAFEVACPNKIVTSQKIVGGAPGWKEFVRPDGNAKLPRWSYVSGINLYSGDPKNIAQLKPDDENAKEASWSFSTPSSPDRPLYMACIYFDTRIQFIKALPLNVRKCTSSRERVLRCEEFKPPN